jgi:hypothetical protein
MEGLKLHSKIMTDRENLKALLTEMNGLRMHMTPYSAPHLSQWSPHKKGLKMPMVPHSAPHLTQASPHTSAKGLKMPMVLHSAPHLYQSSPHMSVGIIFRSILSLGESKGA